jgi:hypothetical protein
MHIKLPYAFQVTGKVPGTRKMDRVIAADWLSINVASASFLDAPVCVSWSRRHDYNFFDYHAVGEEGRVDIRTFNGNFYRPLTGVGALMEVDDITERLLIDYDPHTDNPEKLIAAQVSFACNKGGYPRPSFEGETRSNEQDIAQALTERRRVTVPRRNRVGALPRTRPRSGGGFRPQSQHLHQPGFPGQIHAGSQQVFHLRDGRNGRRARFRSRPHGTSRRAYRGPRVS